MNGVIFKAVLAVFLFAASGLASALEVVPFSKDGLLTLQKAEKPVALLFHADWCPTCRAQGNSLKELTSEAGLEITVLQANYDTERELKREYAVRAQSTLIVLRGSKETARLIGDTSKDSIRQALKSAL